MLVADLNRTVAFYREMPGFEVVAETSGPSCEAWALVRWDDIALVFQSVGIEKEAGGSMRGATGDLRLTYRLYVDDVTALYERIRGRVHVLGAPRSGSSGGAEFSIEDCNGFVLTFIQAEAN